MPPSSITQPTPSKISPIAAAAPTATAPPFKRFFACLAVFLLKESSLAGIETLVLMVAFEPSTVTRWVMSALIMPLAALTFPTPIPFLVRMPWSAIDICRGDPYHSSAAPAKT